MEVQELANHLYCKLFTKAYTVLFAIQLFKIGMAVWILVVAPTGKAAYNVKGSTIHSALHIPASQSLHDYKQMSHDTLNTYQMKYKHLQWIFF